MSSQPLGLPSGELWGTGPAGAAGPCLVWSVHRVLGPQLLALFRLWPSLVLELAKELLEFVSSGVGSRGSLLICVVRLLDTPGQMWDYPFIPWAWVYG